MARTGRPPEGPTGHGSEVMYRKGCRCEPCRARVREIQAERRMRAKNHAGDYVVSAEMARAHIEMLSRAGVGYRSVAEYAAMQPQYVGQIKSGKRSVIRMSTEQRIMRINRDMVADHGYVSAAKTKRMVQEMLDAGYRRHQIARMLGYAQRKDRKGYDPHLQLNLDGMVLAKTERKVKRLHAKLVVNRVARMTELAAIVVRRAAA